MKLLTATLLLFILVACNPTNKVQRAYKKVKNDLNRTQPELKILADLSAALFPYTYTGRDTLILIEEDTAARQALLDLLFGNNDGAIQPIPMPNIIINEPGYLTLDDSLWHPVPDCSQYTKKLDKLRELLANYKPVIKTVTISDTIVDMRPLTSAVIEKNYFEKQYLKSEANYQAEKKQRKTFMWLFIAAAGVVGVGIGVWVKQKVSLV
jgi:hypothetical protein